MENSYEKRESDLYRLFYGDAGLLRAACDGDVDFMGFDKPPLVEKQHLPEPRGTTRFRDRISFGSESDADGFHHTGHG
jgi:hypothetical protein